MRVVVAEGEVDFLLRVQLGVQLVRQELADLLLELSRREHGLPSIGPRWLSTRMRGCVCAVSMRSVAPAAVIARR